MFPHSNLFDSRLMEQLLEKEREYQAILQQVLEEREQEIRLLRLRSEPAGLEFYPIYLFTLTVCNTSHTSAATTNEPTRLWLTEATPLSIRS